MWVFDPLDGPGVDERLAELGQVAGVAVLSSFHARDAAAVAERHDVAVHLPEWMDRAAKRVDARTDRYAAPSGEWVELAGSGIAVRAVDPTVAWREMVAHRPSDGTLRVPDLLAGVPDMTVGNERVGCYLLHRLAPPTAPFDDVSPDRVLFGHGEGVFVDAADAVEYALENARRNFPRALVSQAPAQLRGVVGAVLD